MESRQRNVVFAHDSNAFGGMELYLLRLISNLDSDRYRPTLLIPGFVDEFRSSPEQLVREARARGVPVLRAQNLGQASSFYTIKELLAVTQLLKLHQTDVLHIHTCRPDGARKVTLAARLAGVRAIVRTEHMPPEVNMTWRSRYFAKPFDWMTDKIVTGSKGDREAQIRLLKRAPEKVICAHNSVEWEKFDPDHNIRAAKEGIGLDPDVSTIGTIGRLVEQKGQKHLIEAFAKILHQLGPLNLLLVGDGELKPTLNSLAEELGILEHVHFLGFQTDVRPFIYAMDVAVMPSLWEVFSLSMLEFMASGKAIVSSDHSSFKEALIQGECGLIVPRQNSAALADAVCHLLTHPEERERLGRNALQRVRDHFGFDRLADDMMNLYDDILSKAVLG